MALESNLKVYGVISTILFLYTVVNAFRERSNFYSAAVYLSKSNACMMILWNQGIYQTVLLGKFLQQVFFGELRMLEVERLQERGWFAITETLLALTIFKEEFESSFVLLFVSLLFLKVFHWLAGDRVELMEQSAHISRVFHLRMISLLMVLWLMDALLLTHAIDSILLEGPTVMIMFASEYMILLAMVWSTTMKYAISAIDLRSEGVWEEKSMYIFYVDLATDFFKLVTYLTFFGLILTFYGLPLNILRDVYITFRSFVLKCRDLKRYRQATKNMDQLYPNATQQEMEEMRDKTCIICREDMAYRGPATGVAADSNLSERAGDSAINTETATEPLPAPIPASVAPHSGGPNDTPKKLPCGHVFHFHCLRSWLERQQSCPTCRRPVLASEQQQQQPHLNRLNGGEAPVAGRGAQGRRGGVVPDGHRGVQGALNGEEAIRQARINLARNLGREAFGIVFPGVVFPAEADPASSSSRASEGAGRVEAIADSTTTGSLAQSSTAIAGSSGSSASSGQSRGNPLAQFSLPGLPLPPGGEADLCSSVPQLRSIPSHSNRSYGDYSHVSHSTASNQPFQAQALRMPNLEERLTQIRTRMANVEIRAGVPPEARIFTQVVPSESPTLSTAALPKEAPLTTTTETTEPSASADSANDQASKDESLSRAADTLGPTAREAAFAAAERRAAIVNGVKGRSSSQATNTANHSSPPPTVVETPAVSSSPRSPDLRDDRPSVVEEVGSGESRDINIRAGAFVTSEPNPAVGLPRLIPLFNALDKSASRLYPTLLSDLSSIPSALEMSPVSLGLHNVPRPLRSQPLLPRSPTEQQIKDMSNLTRKGMEERLRVLLGFQDKMSALAEEIKSVLSALPLDSGNVDLSNGRSDVIDATEAKKVDKGKKPMEGINSVVGEEYERGKKLGDMYDS